MRLDTASSMVTNTDNEAFLEVPLYRLDNSSCFFCHMMSPTKEEYKDPAVEICNTEYVPSATWDERGERVTVCHKVDFYGWAWYGTTGVSTKRGRDFLVRHCTRHQHEFLREMVSTFMIQRGLDWAENDVKLADMLTMKLVWLCSRLSENWTEEDDNVLCEWQKYLMVFVGQWESGEFRASGDYSFEEMAKAWWESKVAQRKRARVWDQVAQAIGKENKRLQCNDKEEE